jgi:hypothetical protein
LFLREKEDEKDEGEDTIFKVEMMDFDKEGSFSEGERNKMRIEERSQRLKQETPKVGRRRGNKDDSLLSPQTKKKKKKKSFWLVFTEEG